MRLTPCGSTERGVAVGSRTARRARGRCVAGIAAGGDHRQLDAVRLGDRERLPHERAADARALVLRVDGDHVDLAGLCGVLGDQPDGDEADHAVVDAGDPDVVPLVEAHGAHGGGLCPSPVRIDHGEDPRAELLLEAREHRGPGGQGQHHYGVEVDVDEAAGDDASGCAVHAAQRGRRPAVEPGRAMVAARLVDVMTGRGLPLLVPQLSRNGPRPRRLGYRRHARHRRDATARSRSRA